jgi:hypothetical protein
MNYKHTILLSDQEEQMLQKLINQRGYRKQEVFRYRLRDLYKKEFPAYNTPKRKPLFDDYTDKEYCENVKHGQVEGKFCVFTQYGEVKKIPLARIKILG